MFRVPSEQCLKIKNSLGIKDGSNCSTQLFKRPRHFNSNKHNHKDNKGNPYPPLSAVGGHLTLCPKTRHESAMIPPNDPASGTTGGVHQHHFSRQDYYCSTTTKTQDVPFFFKPIVPSIRRMQMSAVLLFEEILRMLSNR